MVSGVQPCFQLLRIGAASGDQARDLYTFRPALSHCVFRLGRAAEVCDVTLDSPSVSRIHAELHAEREASGGTWVNEVRLQRGVQWELSDGDTLTFGGQSAPGSPEFYFLFQKVKVRPLDFDAITIPKAGTFSSDLQNRIRTNLDRKVEANLDLSKLSINRATVILNSIGSLSKMKGSAWTFKRSHSHEGTVSDPGCSSSSSTPPPPRAVGFSSPLPLSTPPSLSSAASAPSAKSLPPTSRSRRKSAHTVLLEDDSSDEPRSRGALAGAVEDGPRARGKKRRRLYKSESEGVGPPLPPQPKSLSDVRRPLEAKPFPVGIRTIGSFHGAMTNSRLNHHHLLQASFANAAAAHKQEAEAIHRIKTVVRGNIAAFRQQKPARGPAAAQRGRRRAHSSPVFSPLVVGGENYSLASPSVRICTEQRGRVQFNRFHHQMSKRRGRPRKHPPPPRPSLPSPSSSSSSSTSSASSSSSGSSSGSGSSSSDEDDEDDDEEATAGSVEPCAAPRCRLPQQDTVQWIQCDVCDAWFHIDCLHVDRKKLLMDPNADFHCGCH
ncbi:hypothetical protein F2P81_023036 [Scophthalmus maximus]|uniref:FHA domain-containing protein n=1 Tax=Scophthalmus maximus TaxID=52904 RepID=A0A6A4S145_SCOMX|nr:hypothetical protein F2P81_023036 [Scophthalmus maximus]